MWWSKKKKVEEQKKEQIIESVKVEEPPKETTRKAIMKLTLINNKTDKEYYIESENDFGLKWSYVGGKDGNYELLVVNQRHEVDEDSSKWTAAGRFLDFSVTKCEWKTFNIS